MSALDLSAVKSALNTNADVSTTTDFNRDGRTNAPDLSIVKRNLNHALLLPVASPVAASLPAPGVVPAQGRQDIQTAPATDLLRE